MKAWSFRHKSNRSMMAISVDRNGGNLPPGPWEGAQEIDLDHAQPRIGLDTRAAVAALEKDGFYIAKVTITIKQGKGGPT